MKSNEVQARPERRPSLWHALPQPSKDGEPRTKHGVWACLSRQSWYKANGHKDPRIEFLVVFLRALLVWFAWFARSLPAGDSIRSRLC